MYISTSTCKYVNLNTYTYVYIYTQYPLKPDPPPGQKTSTKKLPSLNGEGNRRLEKRRHVSRFGLGISRFEGLVPREWLWNKRTREPSLLLCFVWVNQELFFKSISFEDIGKYIHIYIVSTVISSTCKWMQIWICTSTFLYMNLLFSKV